MTLEHQSNINADISLTAKKCRGEAWRKLFVVSYQVSHKSVGMALQGTTWYGTI